MRVNICINGTLSSTGRCFVGFEFSFRSGCECLFHLCWRQKISIIRAQVFLDVKSLAFSVTFTNIRGRQHLHPCQQGNWVGGFETDSPVRAGLYRKQLLGSHPWRTQCFLTDALWVKSRRNNKSTRRTSRNLISKSKTTIVIEGIVISFEPNVMKKDFSADTGASFSIGMADEDMGYCLRVALTEQTGGLLSPGKRSTGKISTCCCAHISEMLLY